MAPRIEDFDNDYKEYIIEELDELIWKLGAGSVEQCCKVSLIIKNYAASWSGVE